VEVRGSVVLPILLVAVLAGLALSVPLPDWDLPAIRWPDLPAVPWPDWSVPGWLEWLLAHAKHVWPVVLAYLLARREIARRRSQDELRAARAGQPGDED
jgi:hypothetical protein